MKPYTLRGYKKPDQDPPRPSDTPRQCPDTPRPSSYTPRRCPDTPRPSSDVDIDPRRGAHCAVARHMGDLHAHLETGDKRHEVRGSRKDDPVARMMESRRDSAGNGIDALELAQTMLSATCKAAVAERAEMSSGDREVHEVARPVNYYDLSAKDVDSAGISFKPETLDYINLALNGIRTSAGKPQDHGPASGVAAQGVEAVEMQDQSVDATSVKNSVDNTSVVEMRSEKAVVADQVHANTIQKNAGEEGAATSLLRAVKEKGKDATSSLEAVEDKGVNATSVLGAVEDNGVNATSVLGAVKGMDRNATSLSDAKKANESNAECARYSKMTREENAAYLKNLQEGLRFKEAPSDAATAQLVATSKQYIGDFDRAKSLDTTPHLLHLEKLWEEEQKKKKVDNESQNTNGSEECLPKKRAGFCLKIGRKLVYTAITVIDFLALTNIIPVPVRNL